MCTLLQWNGGYFIRNPVDAFNYQVSHFPDWAVEVHAASAATKTWTYTVRVYDQHNIYNNNGQNKCVGACEPCRPMFIVRCS